MTAIEKAKKVAAAKKRAAAAKKKAAVKSSKSLPQAANIPAGMRQIGGGYASTWEPEVIGASLHGVVSDLPKAVTLNKGNKKKENKTRVMEVTDMEGARFALWESVVLEPLFDEIAGLEDSGLGVEVYIQYNGLGKKKPGQNPAKLFTVAIAE